MSLGDVGKFERYMALVEWTTRSGDWEKAFENAPL